MIDNEEKPMCDRCGATATTTVRSWVGTMHDQCAGCATQTRAEAEAEMSPPMPGSGVPPRCGACHPQDGANPDHHTGHTVSDWLAALGTLGCIVVALACTVDWSGTSRRKPVSDTSAARQDNDREGALVDTHVVWTCATCGARRHLCPRPDASLCCATCQHAPTPRAR